MIELANQPLEEKMAIKNPRDGLHHKYSVSRIDGRDIGPDSPHYSCITFVLDVTHDPASRPAIEAYIEAIRDTQPDLAEDLTELLATPVKEKNG